MLERKCDACEAARKVIDVWRDADAMLAYLRGDPSALYDAIEAMAGVLKYRTEHEKYSPSEEA